MTEKESKILAALRNKMGAICSYFDIQNKMDEMKESQPENYKVTKKQLKIILEKTNEQAKKDIKLVKKLLDSFG